MRSNKTKYSTANRRGCHIFFFSLIAGKNFQYNIGPDIVPYFNLTLLVVSRKLKDPMVLSVIVGAFCVAKVLRPAAISP